MNVSIQHIENFFRQKHLAFVGVSRNSKDFTRSLFREFVNRGYDVVPVNPNASELDGQQVFAQLQDIEQTVQGVLIMTAPEKAESIVQKSLECGIRQIWLLNGRSLKMLSDDTLARCKQNEVTLISGMCPYMFLSDTGFVHRLHGWVWKLTGKYPHRNRHIVS